MADLTALAVRLQGQRIGTLTRLPNDQNIFVFDAAYIDNPQRPTLSLSFKDAYGGLITELRPTQTRLPPFFSNLLPEEPLRAYLAERAQVRPEREFFLARALGRDLPGALEIAPLESDNLPRDAHSAEPTPSETQSQGSALRFSLAGVQLKFSAVLKASGGLTIPADGVGGSWIVKLPSQRFAAVPENEFAMMELARSVGIEVPETKLVPVDAISGLPAGIEILGDKVFTIKRFDRGENGEKTHMEDFAQVFGVYPARKYERASYRNIAQVLWIETGEAGIAEFIRRLAFNALIGNADMHLKNWSLLYPDTRTAQLAPAYDFVSTIAFLPDDNMALSLTDSKAFASVTRDQFIRFAAKAGLPQKLVVDATETTVAAFAHAWKNTELPAIDDKTRQAISKHLKTLPLWKEFTGRGKSAN